MIEFDIVDLGSTVSGGISRSSGCVPFWVLAHTGSIPVTTTWEFGKMLLRHSFMAADIGELFK